MPSYTMTDIARASGVSLATVGRVLNGNGYVSQEKREAVERVVRQTGYVQNRIAQGLKKSHSHLIGHITVFNRNMQYERISEALHKAAAPLGYQVLTMTAAPDIQSGEQMVNEMIGRRVDGLILSSHGGMTEDLLRRVTEHNIPVVMVERTLRMKGVDRVVVSDYMGAYEAVSAMLEKGHRRIGFIGAKQEHEVELRRRRGYLAALSQCGCTPEEALLQEMPSYSVADGALAAERLLNLAEPPSAVFMTSDLYACGVLQTCYARHLRVPEDLSLVGYDNTLSQLLSPPVSSMGLQFDLLAEGAMSLLLRRMAEPNAPEKTLGNRVRMYDRHTVICATGTP